MSNLWRNKKHFYISENLNGFRTWFGYLMILFSWRTGAIWLSILNTVLWSITVFCMHASRQKLKECMDILWEDDKLNKNILVDFLGDEKIDDYVQKYKPSNYWLIVIFLFISCGLGGLKITIDNNITEYSLYKILEVNVVWRQIINNMACFIFAVYALLVLNNTYEKYTSLLRVLIKSKDSTN